jgi:hypothetical protein
MWVLLCICFVQHILKIEPEDFHVVYAVYRWSDNQYFDMLKYTFGIHKHRVNCCEDFSAYRSYQFTYMAILLC